MLLSLSMKLLTCLILLLLLVRAFSLRFDSKYRGKYRCQSDATCSAVSNCPPERRLRVVSSPQCFYIGRNRRRIPGICCRNAAINTFTVWRSAEIQENEIERDPLPKDGKVHCRVGYRCLALSKCSLSQRPKEIKKCFNGGYSKWNPGICCVDPKVDLPNAAPSQLPFLSVSTTTALPMTPQNGDCGRSFSPSGFMMGGRAARQGVFPWMVAITDQNGRLKCTGSLIDSTHVLTAAHCIHNINPKHHVLRIGNVDYRLGDVYYVRNIEIPKNYRKDRYQNDVAVVTLDRPVSTDFMPICLPDSKFRNFTGEGVTVAGWGITKPGGTTSNILQQLNEVPVVSNYQCDKIYRRYIHDYQEHFPSGMNRNFICAGFSEGGKDSCDGDSGGPMMISQDSRWYQIGVLSFGHVTCGKAGYPAAYTRLSSFINFILPNL